MKKIFFALILNLFFIYSAKATDGLERYREECASFVKRPQVDLVASYGKLRYKFDKDAEYLRRETREKFAEQNQEMDDDFVPAGLTKVRDTFDLDFTAGSFGVSHGYICVYPETIKARLEYTHPTIYILNSLDKDSCFYKVAVRHENTHMQIYIDALDYFLPKLKKYMEGLFDEIGFIVIAKDESEEDAAKKLNEAYINAIQNKIEEWHKEVETEQLKLDSPENYALENMLCQNIEKN